MVAVAVALVRSVRLVLASHHRGRAAQVWHRLSPVRPLPVAVVAVVVTEATMVQAQVRLVVLAAAVKVATILVLQPKKAVMALSILVAVLAVQVELLGR